MSTTGRRRGRLARDDLVHPRQLDLQDCLVQEEERGKGLVLRRGRHVAVVGQGRKEGGDVFGTEIAGMPSSVEMDVATNPVDVRLFRAAAVVQRTNAVTHLVQEGRGGRSGPETGLRGGEGGRVTVHIGQFNDNLNVVQALAVDRFPSREQNQRRYQSTGTGYQALAPRTPVAPIIVRGHMGAADWMTFFVYWVGVCHSRLTPRCPGASAVPPARQHEMGRLRARAADVVGRIHHGRCVGGTKQHLANHHDICLSGSACVRRSGCAGGKTQVSS